MRHCRTHGPLSCARARPSRLRSAHNRLARFAMLVVSGSCCGFPASVLLDCSSERSCLSTRFALHHKLPISGSASTSASLVVPTPSGWYSYRADLAVDYVREHDVVLGAESCRALRFDGGMPVIPDPSGCGALPCSVTWAPSPSNGASPFFLVVGFSPLS